MCITKCMHMECHLDIFGSGGGGRAGEMEPGEVDEERESQFEHCVRESIKNETNIKK